MGRRKRIKWDHGDVFAVPLVDGTFGLVQAIDHWMPRWIYTAITEGRVTTLTDADTKTEPGRLVALLAVDDDPFNFGGFPCVGRASPMVHRRDFPNEAFAHNGYVGAKSYTGGIVADFLSAWHQLAPWNAYKDAAYFDKLLISGIERPSAVLMKAGS
jgi:hypothetical protein